MGRIESVAREGDAVAPEVTCRFLNNFSFDALIAPVTREDFVARHWQWSPLLVQRHNPEFYGDLFSLTDFDRNVATGPNYVKIAEAKANLVGRNEGATASGLDKTLGDMARGATLVLDALQQRDPKLGLLCRLLAQEVGHAFQTNLYLTPPQGQGFTPHWDNHDVFILQVMGSKHWKLEKKRRKFPGSNEVMKEGRELAPDADSFTLEQGDMIYIPRGFVHAAECGSEASLHITLGIHPATWDDILRAAIQKAVTERETLRYALPLGFLRSGPEPLVKQTASVLRKVADERFIAEVVEQYLDELVAKHPIDTSGQIEDFYHPIEIGPGDIFGLRRGVIFRSHTAEDSVRVNVGTRAVVFLGIFREALDFALRVPVFAVRDLPGDLHEEEKVAFTQRLLQEGLIVRK